MSMSSNDISDSNRLRDNDLQGYDDTDKNKVTERMSSRDDSLRSKEAGSELETSDHRSTPNKVSFSKTWTEFIKTWFHRPIMAMILFLTGIASHRPKQTIAFMTALSIGLVVIGLFTNFNVDVDEDVLWTPMKSKPVEYMNWISDESKYPKDPRNFLMFFHSNGQNVLGQQQVSRIFQAIDTVRNHESYAKVCLNGTVSMFEGNGTTEVKTCDMYGVNKFWNSSSTVFSESANTDDDVIAVISSRTFPDGTPVAEKTILGYPVRKTTDVLTSALSYTVIIMFPDTSDVADVELDYVDAVLALNDVWSREGGADFRVEVQAEGSFASEFQRAIVTDLPLIPIVFIIMAVFTCVAWWKKDRVRSRSLLGLMAVVSVFLSIICAFGLLFIIGTPFTSMTQILPFIVFGVGLDDAYIIMGSYERTNPKATSQERVKTTMEDIGISITLTTMTSITSFGLGATSSIPAVYWLCLYAFPTIALVYVYQLTFFIGCVVIDDRRIMANNPDCCCSCACGSSTNSPTQSITEERQDGIMDRFMLWYAGHLMQPWIKILVIIDALAICGFLAYSSTNLTQEFKFTDVLPQDSYITDFQTASDTYSESSFVSTGAYFRFVDQLDMSIMNQMDNYVNDLVNMKSISSQPDQFWVRDFKSYINQSATNISIEVDYVQLLDAFMNVSVYNEMYRNDIVRNPDDGTILTSRCFLNVDQVDVQDVQAPVDAYEDQAEITENQIINKGKAEFLFFNYDSIHNIWDFYSVIVGELILNTILGIVSVTALAFLIMPHWTAAVFVFPMVCIVYVDMLGFMQLCGVHINAVSYIAMVMSIGLLVDYIMHVLLRYYECSGNRKEKTIELLHTMGSSILLGGVSTFLGTLPLAFSSSEPFL